MISYRKPRTAVVALGFLALLLPGLANSDDQPVNEMAALEMASVYFPHGSTSLTFEAQGYLDEVAGELADHEEAHLMIVGYADRSGSSETNQRVAAARAFAVEDALVVRGISADRMRVVTETHQADDWQLTAGLMPKRFVGKRRTDIVAVPKDALAY